MNNVLMQQQAEVKILEYKLDRIRKHLNNRINIVDPVTKAELSAILGIICEYEIVPAGWNLETPLVPIQNNEEEN